MLGPRGPEGEGALGQGSGAPGFAEATVNGDMPKPISANLPRLPLPTGRTVSGNRIARNLRYFLPKLTSG